MVGPPAAGPVIGGGLAGAGAPRVFLVDAGVPLARQVRAFIERAGRAAAVVLGQSGEVRVSAPLVAGRGWPSRPCGPDRPSR